MRNQRAWRKHWESESTRPEGEAYIGVAVDRAGPMYREVIEKRFSRPFTTAS